MFQIQDILIPARFICYILQVLLTIAIGIAYKDFINTERYPDLDEYKDRYWGLLSLFYAFELFEFFILLLGYTLFIDLLSVVQIFFHSLSVIFLNWFYRDVWESDWVALPLILGGIIPGLLEFYNLIILCNSNRRITKIK